MPFLSKGVMNMLVRLSQVNWLENLAGDIASAQPTGVTPRDAKSAVLFWMCKGFDPPDWFDDHDQQLLIDLVEKALGR